MSVPASADCLDRIVASVRRTYAGRRWLVTADVLQPALRVGATLQQLGAHDVFALGASMGTGALAPGVRHACLNVHSAGVMEGIRSSEAAMSRLPAELQQRIDDWDPHHEACAVTPLFSSGADVAGRRCWGARRPEWLALEDKTVVDRIWDECGLPRSPARVVPAQADALMGAHEALDAGRGTVWAADNREGWHGGATATRWVHDEATARVTTAWMQAHADRVRVMPFLEGIPCSIHGMVFDDEVIAFRPCEMVVYRQPARGRFVYGRASTLWDPAPGDRAAMRDAARRVGRWLRERVQYRGTFTMDGVMGVDGFRPTELNPRFGAAISLMGRSLPGLDLYLLHLAIVEGVPLDFAPAGLESLLTEAADRHRQASTMQVLPRSFDTPRKEGFVRSPHGWKPAGDDPPHAVAELGPAAMGSMLFISADPAHFPTGAPFAPPMAELIGMLDQRWELGIGPLEAAQRVR